MKRFICYKLELDRWFAVYRAYLSRAIASAKSSRNSSGRPFPR